MKTWTIATMVLGMTVLIPLIKAQADEPRRDEPGKAGIDRRDPDVEDAELAAARAEVAELRQHLDRASARLLELERRAALRRAGVGPGPGVARPDSEPRPQPAAQHVDPRPGKNVPANRDADAGRGPGPAPAAGASDRLAEMEARLQELIRELQALKAQRAPRYGDPADVPARRQEQ